MLFSAAEEDVYHFDSIPSAAANATQNYGCGIRSADADAGIAESQSSAAVSLRYGSMIDSDFMFLLFFHLCARFITGGSAKSPYIYDTVYVGINDILSVWKYV